MSVEKTLHNYGFSLRSVTWGYRDIFKSVFEKLFDEDYLGPRNTEVTGSFFRFMRCADEQFFDHVLKEFLEALAGEQKWILSIPALFEGIVELGYEFAQEKLYYGIDYFKVLKSGGFGNNPGEVSHCIAICRRLFSVDPVLAHAFLQGYAKLLPRLEKAEIDRYIDYGLTIYKRNISAAVTFLRGELQTSETYIREITKEVRLHDITDSLVRYTKGISGIEVEYDDLSKLDSDELLGRGSRFVQLYKWAYLPHLIRYYRQRERNRNVYDVLATIVGGMLAFKSFPTVHGHPDYESCSRMCGYNVLRENLFMICEYTRVLRLIREHWPGAEELLAFAINEEKDPRPSISPPDALFFDCIGAVFEATSSGRFISEPDRKNASVTDTARSIVAVAKQSVNFFHSLSLLDNGATDKTETAGSEYPGIENIELRSFSFLPDFRFPARVTSPPSDEVITQMKEQAKKTGEEQRQSSQKKLSLPSVPESDRSTSSVRPSDEEERAEEERALPCFLYDEWSVHENCYYTDHCRVYEINRSSNNGNAGRTEGGDQKSTPKGGERVRTHVDEQTEQSAGLPEIPRQEIQNVRRLFELIKPELQAKEKLLPEGETINPDRLVNYIVDKHVEPSPKINFYERTFLNKRDLAVVLLLDISGSTGEESAGETIIDTIKKSALLLGEGLHTLDDRFAICGFSGTGRENCKYVVYKDFSDPWNREVMKTIHAARPLSSTRIGPALRHSGYKLSEIDAKKRLILLITDGRPMDKEYDASTHYAQYDVRGACEENRKQDIHTFCISTNENSRADMEIMFPQKRFVILEGFHDLPAILPRLYLRLTV